MGHTIVGARALAGAWALSIALTACAPAPAEPAGAGGCAVAAPTEIPHGSPVVIAAAGDIAGRQHRDRDTARLLEILRLHRGLAAILALGDIQYPRGEYHAFLADYDRSWGRPALRALTRPVPGNHDYALGRSNADGYFDYFNGRGERCGPAGERGRGYYSFDMGDWHLVALNTSDGCGRVACAAGSPMHAWLVADLARTAQPCVLAYAHHPRFQQGAHHGDDPAVAPLWDALHDAGADLLLAGHEHGFQQIAPLDKEGRLDPGRGLRTFVVGTGGARPYTSFTEAHLAGLIEARLSRRYGVLELTLGPGWYRWRFVSTGGLRTGGTVLAAGEGRCHGAASRQQ